MARKAASPKATRPSTRSTEPLYSEVRAVLEAARSHAYRAVNSAMVQAYWNVGRLIVEHEQGGRRRAAYGVALIENLSGRLTAEFGRGFDVRNLRHMRQFYLAFPSQPIDDRPVRTQTRNAPRAESRVPAKRNAVRSVSPTLPSELSWTHFRLLLSVDDPTAREWYMCEAVSQHWSTRQLERQISVLYYERLLASQQKKSVRKEAVKKLAKWTRNTLSAIRTCSSS